MAYDAKGLQRQGGHGVTAASTGIDTAFIKASYITPDAAATVETAGYFNSAWERLPKNTIIEAVMVANGTPVHKTYIVTASSASAVTIAVQAVSAG
jgi:hypothetical protein